MAPCPSSSDTPHDQPGPDLTHQLEATPERIDRLRALAGRLAGLLAGLFVFPNERPDDNCDVLIGLDADATFAVILGAIASFAS